MSDFDLTAYILYKQAKALADELNGMEIPAAVPQAVARRTSVEAARGPIEAFNNLLPRVREVLAVDDSFASALDALCEHEPQGRIGLTEAGRIRTDVALLVRTLEAFIEATFPAPEKQRIGFA